MTEQAKRGVNSCPTILDYMATVPDEVVPEAHFAVWIKMRDLAASGSPPTLPALRRSLPNFSPDYWIGLKSDESSIRDVRDALLHDAQRKRYVQFHGDLKRMIVDGTPFDTINEKMANLADESLSGVREAVPLSEVSFMDRILAMEAGTIPMVETPWPQLNKALGGGLFMGGDLAMTAVLAFSGVGKTRWAQQVNVHANANGHWVMVLAGESNRFSYMQGMATLVSATPKSMIGKGMSKTIIEDLRKAEKIIQGWDTYVYDMKFNVDIIRALMSRLKRKLMEAKTAGTAPKHAQMLVIVDNIDHAVDGSGDRAWSELEQAAKGLYNTAQRLESHIIVLAQCTKSSFLSGYAPGQTDFARANLISSHCSNIIGLYRPILQEQQDASDTRAMPKFGLPKTRSGESNPNIPCEIQADLGAWL